MLTTKRVKRTSKQVQRHLLCKKCEVLLSQKGENWVMPRLAAKSGFLLGDLVEQIAPRIDKYGGRFYPGASVQEIDVDQLVHFAMGIFWKASVDDWGLGQVSSQIELGTYREQIRRFLLGEIPFPRYMNLLMIVAAQPIGVAALKLPMEGNRANCHTFNFLVPGLAFMLCVGKTIPAHLAECCFCSGKDHPILMMDLRGKVTQWANKALGEAKISKKFLESLNANRKP